MLSSRSFARPFTRSILGRVGALVLALAPLGPLPACNSMTCGLVACESGARATLTLPSRNSLAFPLTIEECRNGACRTATLAAPANETDTFATTAFPDPNVGATATDPTAEISPGAAASTLRVQWTLVDGDAPQNGDRYAVTVTDANGATLAMLDKTATYTDDRPNGPGCPPVCKGALLQ